MVAATSTAPAQQRAGAGGPAQKPVLKQKTDVQRCLERLVEARSRVAAVEKWVSAWVTAVAEAKAEDKNPKGLKHLLAALDHKSPKLSEACAIFEALVESKWKPPAVKISSAGSGVEFKEGAPVAFRKFHLDWGLTNGVFSKEEAESLVVVSVRKGAKGTLWVTARSEKTGNHFGPYQGSSKFIVR